VKPEKTNHGKVIWKSLDDTGLITEKVDNFNKWKGKMSEMLVKLNIDGKNM